MDKPKRKLAGGILLLAVLGIVYFVFLLKTNAVVNGAYNLDSYIDKIEAINSSVKVILDQNTYVHKREVIEFSNRVALGAVAAKGRLQSDWDGKSLSRYGIRTPSHNAGVTMEILLLVLFIGIWMWYTIKGESTGGSLLAFVMHGQWTKGLNLFSFTRMLILREDSDHIKIIANRDIKNVLNKSREISAYDLKVKLSLENYRLRDVEEILEKELPKLQGRIPGLINGPFYRGVSRIRRKSVTLCFEADFEEEDHDEVKRALNHALLDIFDEYGIRRRKTN